MAERQDSKEKEKMSHHKFPRFRIGKILAADICKLHLPRSRTELLRQLQDWTADRFAEKSVLISRARLAPNSVTQNLVQGG